MSLDPELEYDEGLENADPLETDADLGDAVTDGTSNTFTGKGGS